MALSTHPAVHGASFESRGPAGSYIDTAGAYFDLDAGGTFAQVGAKGPGSIGLKLRTVLAGVALTVLTFTSAGVATFLENVNMSSGKTFAAQAVTATTGVFSSTLQVTGNITSQGTGPKTLLIESTDGNNARLELRSGATDPSIGFYSSGVQKHQMNGNSSAFYFDFTSVFNFRRKSDSATAMTLSDAGALGGITTLAMNGALSGVTSLTASGTIATAGQISTGLTAGAHSGSQINWYGNNTLTWFAYMNGDDTTLRLRDAINSVTHIDLITGANAAASYDQFSVGVVLGNATGSNKGVGTLNVLGDIYKNNTAYTNPDYALEWWATGGTITRFRKNPGADEYLKRGGRLTIAGLESYVRKEFHLPGVPLARGAFERHDVLLEKVEELATYIIEQHHEIESLKARLA